MSKVRLYRIICLKRSRLAEKKDDDFISDWYKDSCLFYWRDNYAGYTHLQDEAGLYTLQQLVGAGGSHGDWLVEPVWVDDELPEEELPEEEDPCICREDENNLFCPSCF
jgi:hypothetical protein